MTKRVSAILYVPGRTRLDADKLVRLRQIMPNPVPIVVDDRIPAFAPYDWEIDDRDMDTLSEDERQEAIKLINKLELE